MACHFSTVALDPLSRVSIVRRIRRGLFKKFPPADIGVVIAD
jgi:hypothetical protein